MQHPVTSSDASIFNLKPIRTMSDPKKSLNRSRIAILLLTLAFQTPPLRAVEPVQLSELAVRISVLNQLRPEDEQYRLLQSRLEDLHRLSSNEVDVKSRWDALVIGVQSAEEEAVEFLARRFRVEAYQQAQHDPAAYKKSQSAWTRIETLWRENGARAEDRTELIRWLQQARTSIERGANAGLPQIPEFGPDRLLANNADTQLRQSVKEPTIGAPGTDHAKRTELSTVNNGKSSQKPAIAQSSTPIEKPLDIASAAKLKMEVSKPFATTPQQAAVVKRNAPAETHAAAETHSPEQTNPSAADESTPSRPTHAVEGQPEPAPVALKHEDVASAQETESNSQVEANPANRRSAPSGVQINLPELVATIDGYNFTLGMLESEIAGRSEFRIETVKRQLAELETLAARRKLIRMYSKLTSQAELALPEAAPLALALDLLQVQLEDWDELENVAALEELKDLRRRAQSLAQLAE